MQKYGAAFKTKSNAGTKEIDFIILCVYGSDNGVYWHRL